jgi:hypothetical protein
LRVKGAGNETINAVHHTRLSPAEAILDAAQCSFTSVDIAEDLTLLERYGVRIPVIKDATGRELGWPFDTAQLKAFLAG